MGGCCDRAGKRRVDSAITMLLSESGSDVSPSTENAFFRIWMERTAAARRVYGHIWKMRIEDDAHCLRFVMPDDLSGNFIRIKYKWGGCMIAIATPKMERVV